MNKNTKPSKALVKTAVMPRCSSCANWKNNQSELDYSTHYGICTASKWKFTTTNEGDVCLLDRNKRSDKHMGVNRFENQSNVVPFGKVERSNYCFVTEECFGCVNYNEA